MSIVDLAEVLIAEYEAQWRGRWWTAHDDRIIANVRAMAAAGLEVRYFGRNDVYRLKMPAGLSRSSVVHLISSSIGDDWHTIRFLKQGIFLRYSG